ncbi:helix-turn-helix domain-containing protein [Oceanobacillus rekensis]|uniref:helix-turn-helix domain-containing protein n=1 Tax=Oceanobacillus rekensis TaxID=937927 RepID=UPI000B43027F|nr:helix-turn-helix transcriptional regulator [Oceanobacillus rekensis]
MNGSLMKDVRYVTGFTQKQLGEHLGVTQSAIAHMEAGNLFISDATKKKVIDLLATKNIGQESIYLLSELKKKG